MTKYFLQRADDKLKWEEVDWEVYSNYAKCVTPGGLVRYTGNSYTKDSNIYEIDVKETTPEQLSVLMRIMGIEKYNGSVNGGFVSRPEYIEMRRGKSTKIHKVGPLEC